MPAFRAFLLVMLLTLASYTLVVVANHGINLLPVFFGDMLQMGWPGQFNLDFMCLVTLSGLWIAWRHNFSMPGLGLGLLAVAGGALFLSAYLLIVGMRGKWDSRTLLIGPARVLR